jgi:hypothetical protein
MSIPATPLFCARCSAELTPGEGSFYVVRIEAFADPTPPTIRREDLAGDHKQTFASLLEEMRDLSERELLDQVHRRLVLHLCGRCYPRWIENPAGP